MFAKSTLVSAVAAALGVSAVGIQNAQADGLFFPYVGAGTDVTTIVSVINTSGAMFDSAGAPIATATATGVTGYLHYRLFSKTADLGQYTGATDKIKREAERLATCLEVDTYLPTSLYDLQTFDLSGHYGSATKGVLFNDPSSQNKWQTALGAKTFALGASLKPFRGYLTIDNADSSTGTTLSGEAFLFDFTNGASWGYQGLQYDAAAPATLPLDYAAAGSLGGRNLPIMPLDEITTAFFVTPVSSVQAPTGGVNDYRARITMTAGAALGSLANFFDRDENLSSGSIPRDVVCVGRVNLEDLISDGAASLFADGGWAQMLSQRVVTATAPVAGQAVGTVADPTPAAATDTLAPVAGVSGATVIKLEYNAPGSSTLNGEAVNGTFNNGYLLP